MSLTDRNGTPLFELNKLRFHEWELRNAIDATRTKATDTETLASAYVAAEKRYGQEQS